MQKITWQILLLFLALLFWGAFSTPLYANDKPILEADEVTLDEARGVIIAIGNIDLRYRGDRLYADKLIWQQQKDIVIAEGAVRIHRADGTKMTAARAELSEDLRHGAIDSLRIALPEGAWLRAKHGTRDDTLINLKSATYSACHECPDKPNKIPLWRVKAVRTIHDSTKQDIIYHHARFEVLGVPVFYTPYFTHPSPEVERRSGFLSPSYSSSGRFGFSLTTPYFFDLAPNYDLTLLPRFTAKQNVVLGGTWRHLTKRGQYEISAYGHIPQDDLADIDGNHNFRGGIIGEGAFTSQNGWTAEFQIEESSDAAFFRRYQITSQTLLESRLSLSKTAGAHSFRATSHRYRRTLNDETDSTVDYIAPQWQYRYDPTDTFIGGTYSVQTHFTHSIRNKGLDISELGARVDWQRRDILAGGFVLDTQNRLDIDTYYFGREARDPIYLDSDGKTYIANATAVELSLPLVQYKGASTHTITPRVQAIGASENVRYTQIPYRSTAAVELEYSNLFQIQNPEDEASRVNYGLEYKGDWDNGATASLLVGQSYDLSAKDAALATGYRNHASAIVTQAQISYGVARVIHNMRLTRDGDDLLRHRAGLELSFDRFTISGNYNFLEAGEIDNKPRKEVYAKLDYKLNRHWRLNAIVREDLENDRQTFGQAGVSYEDECTIFNVVIARDNTNAGSVEPDTSIRFNIILKSLSN
ncbi:MAG: LPS-assembly protein LptD [Alphaproteobacteria bacterium]|nr:LPS-assembly protein LptD [Alphaproteobacteria bacterium]